MNINQVELGVIDYVNNEIIPKASGFTKFIIYTGTFLSAGKLEKIANSKRELLNLLEIVKENGDIDIDKVYQGAKQAIQKTGKFEYKGIIFDENDIDKIYQYVKSKE